MNLEQQEQMRIEVRRALSKITEIGRTMRVHIFKETTVPKSFQEKVLKRLLLRELLVAEKGEGPVAPYLYSLLDVAGMEELLNSEEDLINLIWGEDAQDDEDDLSYRLLLPTLVSVVRAQAEALKHIRAQVDAIKKTVEDKWK